MFSIVVVFEVTLFFLNKLKKKHFYLYFFKKIYLIKTAVRLIFSSKINDEK